MGRSTSKVPGVNGVQWGDIEQAISDVRNNLLDGDVSIEMTSNGLGAFQLTTLVYYRLGKHKHVCETTEPWTPSKGRLEAFVFRSIMDTTNEAEREIARLQKLIQ